MAIGVLPPKCLNKGSALASVHSVFETQGIASYLAGQEMWIGLSRSGGSK